MPIKTRDGRILANVPEARRRKKHARAVKKATKIFYISDRRSVESRPGPGSFGICLKSVNRSIALRIAGQYRGASVHHPPRASIAGGCQKEILPDDPRRRSGPGRSAAPRSCRAGAEGRCYPGGTAFMGNGASVAAERDAEREKDPRRRHARESEFEENQRRREEARPTLVRAVRDAPDDFAFTPDAGEGARGPRVRRGRTSTTGRGRVAAAGSTRRGSVVRRRPWPRIRCPGCRAGSRRAKRSSSVSRGPR